MTEGDGGALMTTRTFIRGGHRARRDARPAGYGKE